MKDHEFNKWRNRARRGLPELSARVFALRDKSYMGCGFHYSMERELGWCISRLSDLTNENDLLDSGGDISDMRRRMLAARIVMQVRLKMLYEAVAAAEQSLLPPPAGPGSRPTGDHEP